VFVRPEEPIENDVRENDTYPVEMMKNGNDKLRNTAPNQAEPFVTTIKDRCRVCYTCVRECPAKAIRIAEGQAEVIAERCIGCGNCVRVCSQKAKRVRDAIPEIEALLEKGYPAAAMLAPSFSAEFSEMTHPQLVGMVKALGFQSVHEVGFGADMVALKMRELMTATPAKRYISSACPAVFGFIKRYHPELIRNVAPVVSPMIAMARILHEETGSGLKVVFIGPCIAKKIEAESEEVYGEIDAVMTFDELRRLFLKRNLTPERVELADFDPPHSGKGSLFPIGRGLLEAAGIRENLLQGDVISANGREKFIDAVMEFSAGDVDARLLDVLCCDGCIMGSGMTTPNPPFRRRALVSQYTRETAEKRDPERWRSELDRFGSLDYSRTYIPNDQRISPPDARRIREVLGQMGKSDPEDELNCGACGYATCVDHAVAICNGLAENEMCLPHSIERLHRTVRELNESNEQLANTRQALIHSEKMASMGQLSAGIAHEVNNPLGVILMYAHLLKDEVIDNPEIVEDVRMIVDHADRAKKIVSGLLHFARQNKVEYVAVHVPELIQDCIRAIRFPNGVSLSVENHLGDPIAELDREQMMQVIVNFISNSLAAMPDGGKMTIGISGDDTRVTVSVSDTGMGIPEQLRDKIFEPFFTTKEIGMGTGLGLAITYGIVKMHKGELGLQSNTDPEKGQTGSTFTVTLPRRQGGIGQ